jgi:oligopeptidase B
MNSASFDAIRSFALAWGALVLGSPAPENLQPPTVPQRPEITQHHGRDPRTDEFSWLRAVSVMLPGGADPSEEILKVVQDQNDYTDQMLVPQTALAARIQGELRARQDARDAAPAVRSRIGDYEYWNRKDAGAIAPKYYRARIGGGTEELLIDGPALAGESKYVAIQVGTLSPSGRYLPYTVDLEGDRTGTLYVRDLQTGKVRTVRETVVKTVYPYWEIAWSADDRFIYYSVPGTVGRDTRAVRADLSGPEPVETTVYDELDPDFFLMIKNSASRKYVLLVSWGNGTKMVRAVSAENPDAPLIELSAKRAGHDYVADHVAGRFVIRSNRDGGRYTLWTAPEASPGEAAWAALKTEVPLPEAYDVTAFQNHLFVLGYAQAEQQAFIVSIADGKVTKLAKPDPTAVHLAVDNFDPKAARVRYRLVSAVQPTALVEAELSSGKATILSAPELPGYDPADYEARLHWFPSADGTQVPAYVVKKKSLRDAKTPAFVMAYGHYGSPFLTEWQFRPENSNEFISLLSRGVALVYGIPRGTMDLGSDWAAAGSYRNKMRSLEDTAAILEGLVQAGLTSPDQLVFRGNSAGGLNAGYIANRYPGLLAGIVASRPFVDALNTMLDAEIPLTTQEWPVWGNPVTSAADYDLIRSYSPYDNIRRQRYPAIFAFVSLRDSQVPFWEALKWVSRLQLNQEGDAPVLVRIPRVGSHSGGVGEEALKANAQEQAFALWTAGIRH